MSTKLLTGLRDDAKLTMYVAIACWWYGPSWWRWVAIAFGVATFALSYVVVRRKRACR